MGTIDDATFAADAPPAASADDALRRSLRCECRSDRCRSVSTIAMREVVFGNRQPGRLVFGLLRIAATDTSNPNQKLHTRQHQLPILHKATAFDCGWIPTPPVRTEGTQLRATLVG